jgi:lysophosphatidate acyltransferase
MMKCWPGGNCTALAKKEIFYVWPFGLATWLAGLTFIDRLNPEKAQGTIKTLANDMNTEDVRIYYIYQNQF